MAVAASPIIPADGTLVATDGAALSYTFVYEDGDLSVTGLTANQKTAQSFKDRGKTYSVREVEDQDIEFSFTCHTIAFLGDGATAMPSDVLLKLGVWAAATSKISASQGGAYAVQLAFTAERSNFGATADSSITLKYCRATSVDFGESTPGKWTIKGTCYPLSTDYATLAG